MGTLTSWNPLDLSKLVTGLLYLYHYFTENVPQAAGEEETEERIKNEEVEISNKKIKRNKKIIK